MEKHSKFLNIDRKVVRVFKWISYPSGGVLMFMALLATANVIYSKLFSRSIPSSTDWITYLMIPVVYLAVGYMVLDRGLITVDFIEKRYPQWLKNIVMVIFYLVGIIVNVIISVQVFRQMFTYIQTNKMSSTSALHFPLWPFYLILGIGMIVLAAALLWTIVRVLVVGTPEIKHEAKEDDTDE